MTRFCASLFHSRRRLGDCIIPSSSILCWQQQSIAKTTQQQSTNPVLHKPFSSKTNHSSNKRNYDKPFVTDEGVFVWQSDPTGNNNGSSTVVPRNQLVWGSIMWPSGICLSKYLWYLFHRKTTTTSSTSNHMFPSDRTTILELGCGTGLVGLTAAKLGAPKVTLTDSATSDLRPILTKSAASNGLSFVSDDDSGNLELLHLDWKDVDTFVDIPTTSLHSDGKNDTPKTQTPYYDWIVAADVLYGGGDALFARALAAHLPSAEELGKSSAAKNPIMALVAVPNRTDSPLANFFRICNQLGLSIERLETNNGAAAGASHGQDPIQAFGETRFVPIGNDSVDDTTENNGNSCYNNDSWEEIVKAPRFAPTNRDEIQLFRIQRVRGTARDARSIRRVSRL